MPATSSDEGGMNAFHTKTALAMDALLWALIGTFFGLVAGLMARPLNRLLDRRYDNRTSARAESWRQEVATTGSGCGTS